MRKKHPFVKLFHMVQTPPIGKLLWSMIVGAAMSAIQLPETKALWYLFLAILGDSILGAMYAQQTKRFSASVAINGFIIKLVGCTIGAAAVFIAWDAFKTSTHVETDWNLGHWALAVMTVWECFSITQTYKSMNLPGATLISKAVQSLLDGLDSRRPVLTQEDASAKLEEARQQGVAHP